MDSDQRQNDMDRGRRVRAEVLGQANVAAERSSDAIIPELGALSDEVLWGRIWGRPGLDIKIRSICTIVALLSLERYDYARIHIGGAKNLGIPRSELAEAILQITFYVGLPVVHEGLKLITDVYGTDG
jgi:4-carboxymuconolactone decarboxylase